MSRSQDIKKGLLSAWRENRLHHAYILSGPASTAKLACVEGFAAEVFSGDPENGPVLERIRARNHPDFTRLESGSGDLGVDGMRGLPRLLAFPPLEGSRRIVVIPDAAGVTIQAANSLLKVLEEPPGHTMFFLLCRDPGELLRTIVSRCQVLRFAPLSDEELLAGLGGRGDAERETLLGWSEGSLERAELLLAGEAALPLRRAACERLLELWEASPRVPSSAARWVEKIEGEESCQVVLDSWELLLRDFVLVAAGAEAGDLRFRECHARLAGLARKGGAAAAGEIPERASAINRFRVYRRLNGNLRLDFAALLAELQVLSVGKGAGAV
jgi:DNA polymerase-3 subunit delta'